MDLHYRLVNVFTADGRRLSGNPLCVFENGSGLTDDVMQALARQFNLSETTFILRPSSPGATARVRIFTPAYEMPFAGHPTLGTAHVARAVSGCGDQVVLEMKAGLVQVNAIEDEWTLQTAYPPRALTPSASRGEIAALLGLPVQSISADRSTGPMWVDTGSEQLVVPVESRDDVLAARPDADLLARQAIPSSGRNSLVYVWARTGPDEVVARFFFLSGGLIEDPATGSACANLGGWMIATGARLPLRLRVHQGDCVGRPSRLLLTVDEERRVFVGGQVIDVGRGTVTL